MEASFAVTLCVHYLVVNITLVFHCRFQIFELCHIFGGLPLYLHFVLSSGYET
jgi:hypothetical protein